MPTIIVFRATRSKHHKFDSITNMEISISRRYVKTLPTRVMVPDITTIITTKYYWLFPWNPWLCRVIPLKKQWIAFIPICRFIIQLHCKKRHLTKCMRNIISRLFQYWCSYKTYMHLIVSRIDI